MADGQEGFISHLADTQDPGMNSTSALVDPDNITDHFGEIQLSDLIGEPISDPNLASTSWEEIQSETFFNHEQVSHNTTLLGGLSIYDEEADTQSVTIIGHYLALTIASNPRGHYLYWEGMEPPKLLGYSSQLIAYLPDLPYQEGVHLSPVHGEGPQGTELVEYDSDDATPADHHVYMADIAGGANSPRHLERLEEILMDKLSANVGAEDEAC